MKLKFYIINNNECNQISEKDLNRNTVDNIIENVKKQGYKVKKLEFLYSTYCEEIIKFNGLVQETNKCLYLKPKEA